MRMRSILLTLSTMLAAEACGGTAFEATGASGAGGQQSAAGGAGEGTPASAAGGSTSSNQGGSANLGGVGGGSGGSGFAGANVGGKGGPATCEAAQAPGATGMNQGQACVSCHANQSGNRRFTVAGSLFSDAMGTSALSGATITITDSANAVTKLTTGRDGAFYTTKSVVFPVTVSASKCPDTEEMPTSPTSGDCNSCHTSGNRIHLP